VTTIQISVGSVICLVSGAVRLVVDITDAPAHLTHLWFLGIFFCFGISLIYQGIQGRRMIGRTSREKLEAWLEPAEVELEKSQGTAKNVAILLLLVFGGFLGIILLFALML